MTLRQKAKRSGMPSAEARTASREKLEAFLNGSGSKKTGRKVVKKATTRTTGRKVVKKSTRKSAPAQSRTSGKAKRPTTKATKPKATPRATRTRDTNGDPGRNMIDRLDYSNVDPDDWNPSKESATGRIYALLKKFKDNVDKVYDAIVEDDDLFNFVAPKKTRLGNKRTVEDQHATVAYRINRTRFDFAKATGQHESATNRSNAADTNGTKAKPKRGRPAKAQAKATRSRQTRSTAKAKPKATSTRGRAQKGSQGRGRNLKSAARVR